MSPQDVLNDGTFILLNFVIIDIAFLLWTSSIIYFFVKDDVSASENSSFVKKIDDGQGQKRRLFL